MYITNDESVMRMVSLSMIMIVTPFVVWDDATAKAPANNPALGNREPKNGIMTGRADLASYSIVLPIAANNSNILHNGTAIPTPIIPVIPTPADPAPVPAYGDRSGCSVKIETDLDRNGVIDYQMTEHYNMHGRITLELFDENNDGSVDRKTVYDYSPNGNLLAARSYRDYILRGALIFNYEYDQRLQKLERDNNGDRVADSSTEYKYDQSGRLIKEINDLDEDGRSDSIYYHRYDEQGRIASVDLDRNADETIDRSYQYVWEDGLLRRVGYPGLWIQYRYDDFGRVSVLETWTSGEGGADEWAEFVYSDNLLVRTSRYQANGNWIDELKYEYDEKRRLKKEGYSHHHYSPYERRMWYSCRSNVSRRDENRPFGSSDEITCESLNRIIDR